MLARIDRKKHFVKMKPAIKGAEKSAKGAFKAASIKKRQCTQCMAFVDLLGKNDGNVSKVCHGKKGDLRMCSEVKTSNKADKKSGERMVHRIQQFIKASVCAKEICSSIGRCPRSLCDKCQAGGRSLKQCQGARKCGKKAKTFSPCSKSHNYQKLLYARVSGKSIYHFAYSNRHKMKFQNYEQKIERAPGGKRKFQKKGASGMAVTRIKDLQMQVVHAQRTFSIMKFTVNEAVAIHYDKGQKKRTGMTSLLRRPFFAHLSAAGTVEKLYHSSRDPGNVVLLKAELASMISHTVPREELLQSFETEHQDHEGTHFVQTHVRKLPNGCHLHSQQLMYTTADVSRDQHGMAFTHEGTRLLTICAGVGVVKSKKKMNKKTDSMSRNGMFNPKNAATGKHAQQKGLAGTRIKSKQKGHLWYVCTEGPLKSWREKKCHRRNRRAARRKIKRLILPRPKLKKSAKKKSALVFSSIHRRLRTAHCLRKQHCRKSLLSKWAAKGNHRHETTETIVETDMMQLMTINLKEKQDLEQHRANTRSKSAPRQHVQMLAAVVSLLNVDAAVQTGKYEGGTNTKGHRMLKKLLKQDTTGALHHEAAKVLTQAHPTIEANDATRHKILSALSDAHHGASQATRLDLLQDSTCDHCRLSRKMKTTLFYNFGASPHPIKEVRDYFLKQAELSQPGSDVHTAANSVSSVFASRFEPDHPFFLQMQRDVHSRLRRPLKPSATWRLRDPTLGGVSRHDVQQRIYALSNLGNMVTREDFAVLKENLASEHKQIRAQAVRSLRDVHGQDVTQLLQDTFVHDKSEEVKKEAMDVLLVNRDTTPEDWTHMLSQLIHTRQKLSKVFTEAVHAHLADRAHAPIGIDSVPFAPEELTANPAGLTPDQFQASSMLLQMKAKARGISDGWFTGPTGYTGCTTCRKCLATKKNFWGMEKFGQRYVSQR